MEEARTIFKDTVNNTKVFFTKNKEEANKLSYRRFDVILTNLKKLLKKCNDQNKEEQDDDDDAWTEDVEEAIVKHGGWTRYETDMKKLKEKWQMERFKEEFILSGTIDDEENSNNKNNKRKRNKSVEIMEPSNKRRKQSSDQRISDEEVCLVVLFIPFSCQKGFLRDFPSLIECKDCTYGKIWCFFP